MNAVAKSIAVITIAWVLARIYCYELIDMLVFNFYSLHVFNGDPAACDTAEIITMFVSCFALAWLLVSGGGQVWRRVRR